MKGNKMNCHALTGVVFFAIFPSYYAMAL